MQAIVLKQNLIKNETSLIRTFKQNSVSIIKLMCSMRTQNHIHN